MTPGAMIIAQIAGKKSHAAGMSRAPRASSRPPRASSRPRYSSPSPPAKRNRQTSPIPSEYEKVRHWVKDRNSPLPRQYREDRREEDGKRVSRSPLRTRVSSTYGHQRSTRDCREEDKRWVSHSPPRSPSPAKRTPSLAHRNWMEEDGITGRRWVSPKEAPASLVSPPRRTPEDHYPPVPNRSLCVKGLSRRLTSQHLFEEFRGFGTIEDVKVVTFPDGQSRGFGFVRF